MRKIIWFVPLVLAVLACSLPLGPVAAPGAGVTPDVATLVAAQLTAIAAESAGSTPLPLPAEVTALPAAPASKYRIVYAKGGNIWFLAEGSAPLQLTFSGLDEEPVLSRDGRVAAFRRGSEIFAVNTDGSGERLVVPGSYVDAQRPADATAAKPVALVFVPGGNDLFFDIFVETEGYPYRTYALHRADVDAGSPYPLIPAGAGGGRVVFSPDGLLAALVHPDYISLLRVDGTDLGAVFKFKMVSTYSEWFYFPEVVWKDDSTGFYTVIPASAILENPSEPTRFYYVPVSGDAARLAEFVAAPVWEGFPYIAPNGAGVLYPKRVGDVIEIHVIDASTADRLYTSAPGLSTLGWNPNSRDFAYRGGDPASAWLAQIGSPAVALNDAGMFRGPSWLDESRFLFQSGGELRLRRLPDPSLLLDSAVESFDFVVVP